MEPWTNKIGIIIGVNSTLGVSIVRTLLKVKLIVIGVDNETNNLKDLQTVDRFHFKKVNLNDEEGLIDMMLEIEEIYGGADVLINNIELFKYEAVLDNEKIDEWKQLGHKKVLSLCLCSRELIRNIDDRKSELGHIVNISYFSDEDISKRSHLQMYRATKKVIGSLSMYFRQELEFRDKPVRITNIYQNFETYKDGSSIKLVHPKEFASAVEYSLNAPLHVQVREVVLEKWSDEMF